jgi:hypothetical protein
MRSTLTAEGDVVATIVDHVLSPEKLLALLIIRGFADAQLTTSPTGTKKRKLSGCLATILLSKVRALKGWITVCWGQLMEFELVHTRANEWQRKERREDGEQHDGGWGERRKRRLRSGSNGCAVTRCLPPFVTSRSGLLMGYSVTSPSSYMYFLSSLLLVCYSAVCAILLVVPKEQINEHASIVTVLIHYEYMYMYSYFLASLLSKILL